MLNYILVSHENGIRVFAYYVDGDMESEPGMVGFSDDGDRIRIKKSPLDEFGIYIAHAFSGIDITKDSGCVAWY